MSFVGGHTIGQAFDPSRLDTAVGQDEVESRSKVINVASADHWLIGVGYESEVLDLGGNRLKSARVYYDGPAFEGLPLGQVEQGKATKEEAWLKDEQGERWIAAKRNRYDPDGQLAETKDARESRREYGYDEGTRSFLKLERVWTESGALEYTAEYDKGLGAIVSARDVNGNQTRFQYDGLGRLTAIIGPTARRGGTRTAGRTAMDPEIRTRSACPSPFTSGPPADRGSRGCTP